MVPMLSGSGDGGKKGREGERTDRDMDVSCRVSWSTDDYTETGAMPSMVIVTSTSGTVLGVRCQVQGFNMHRLQCGRYYLQGKQ
jgi:hypothetical protein